MTGSGVQDWDPGTYARFRGLRLRPALDLLMQVSGVPGGDIVDLGCGDGAAAASLRSRFPKRDIVGIDASPAMLARARGYHRTRRADIAEWRPDTPPALIFSNAALHWLGDHATLLPRLAGQLAPGGTLAVQMPAQWLAPSHQSLRDTAAALFPDRFDFAGWSPPVAAAVDYHRLLAPLGDVNVWETDYLQCLPPEASGHPVRHFTQSTAMRPITEKLDEGERDRFIAAYEAALAAACPPEPDGSVLFTFRRLFVVLRLPR